MSMCASEMTPADIAAVTGGGNCNNGSGWGGAWGEWILVFLIFAVFGWGGMGFGGGFGGFGGGGANGALTRGELCQDFNFQNLDRSVQGISQGICDLGYTIANQFGQLARDNCQISATTNSNITNGFNNTNVAMLQGFNGIQSQMASCCCNLERGQDNTRFTIAQEDCATRNLIQSNTRDLIEAQNSGTRAILDAIQAQAIAAKDEKIAALSQQVNGLQLAASQAAQNNYLVNQLRPCPVPAYITCNPYTASYGVTPTGYNNNCGCNSCCG